MSDNLELKQPLFAEGQKEFRDKYRENLKGFYNGYVHVLLVYAIGALGLFYFISHIENVLWWEWAIVPLTLSRIIILIVSCINIKGALALTLKLFS